MKKKRLDKEQWAAYQLVEEFIGHDPNSDEMNDNLRNDVISGIH